MQFTDQEQDKVTLDYRTEHDEPTGEHVLMITRMDDQFLLTNHRQRGIEFPGGKREAGESSRDAMARELFEETGGKVKYAQYIAQYVVHRTNGQPFSKDVYFVEVDELCNKDDYLETKGPVLYQYLDEIPEEQKSYLLRDAAILHCVERVKDLGLYS